MASFVICNSAYHGSTLLELSAPDPHRQAARESSKPCLESCLLLPRNVCLPSTTQPLSVLAMSLN